MLPRANRRVPPRPRVLQRDLLAEVLRGRGPVDGAAHVAVQGVVPVGGEAVGGQAHDPAVLPGLREGGPLEGALGAELGVHVEPALAPVLADEVHHAGQRAVPVAVRGPAAQHLDTVQRAFGGPVPVDPSAEGIVQRDPVVEHDRAAGPAAAQPAERHPLRGGVGDPAAAAAEEREARDLPQRVVERRRGVAGQVLAREHGDAGRALPRPGAERAARHRDLLAKGERAPSRRSRRTRRRR